MHEAKGDTTRNQEAGGGKSASDPSRRAMSGFCPPPSQAAEGPRALGTEDKGRTEGTRGWTGPAGRKGGA